MANIKDVAKLAGVSISTVSRVVNKSTGVTEQKSNAVLRAMQELNYQPNTFAKALVCNKSDLIGLVVSDISDPMFGKLMQSVESVAQKNARQLLIRSGGKKAESEKEAIQALLNARCDALIIYSRFLTDHQLMELLDGHPAAILVNRMIPDIEDHCVFVSNRKLCKSAIDYLQTQGHTEIALILPDWGNFETSDLHQGYMDGLAMQGVIYDEHLVAQCQPSVEGGYQATLSLLEGNTFFSAILACDEYTAAGCLKALTEQKVKVPGDLSLLTIGSGVLSSVLHPKISLIKHPIKKIGIKATKLALSLPGDEEESEKHSLNTEIISGETISIRR